MKKFGECLGLAGTVFLIVFLALPANADKGNESRGKTAERGFGHSIRQLFKMDGQESNDDSAENRGSRRGEKSEQDGDDDEDATEASVSPTASVSPSPAGKKGKERSCEAHLDSIQHRSDHLVRMANNMLHIFDKIAGRVEEYYSSKVLPSGKSVPNYDALRADIDNKKNVVIEKLATAEATTNSISCTDANPKEDINQFRFDMQAVKTALHEYRRSVRNLIVGVRSIAPVTSSSPSPSPTILPSDSPSPTPSVGPSPTP